MSELPYYRSVKSLAIWKAGKQQKAILSSEHAERYLRDIKEGKGFPSLWLPSSPEDLEKISLGILLRKGHLDTVNLVGLNESCFRNVGIEVSKVEVFNFPIPTVGHLHYELCTTDDNKLTAAIEIFLKCNGNFADFIKSDPNKINMRKIAAKYIDEVSESYKQKAQEWAKQYLQ
ncbi:hypothetical protein ACF3DV_22230 [Chlorogloeopsis fritschii PCC 9212]|uniref:Uncharacterized protein n=1 Tax=Chlorogloeopsis fritschii PCC 6912 TaxID=211165 RepID=A0A3S1FDY8_CHLFR|nr:hypothetical protein [Chlorogloeopsis fritschii]RUR76258.1 hypothetical protein PCC6912_44300 [Chlorogloeopsis fritschii PCC 6912]